MSFYKWAIINEKVFKNPMDKISTIKREKKVVDTLSDEETEIIRCTCDNERDLAIIDILSGSGMRVSELSRLNKTDVNFETNEMKVFGKGSKERICFLTGKAKVHLRWYLDSREDDNPALFVTAKKPYNRLTKNGIEFILKNIAKKTGISRLRLYPHKYRSTFATNLLNKGADLSTISKMMGHQSVDTTLSVYCDYKTDTLKRDHDKYIS
jgi:site-specific recombinase XerD